MSHIITYLLGYLTFYFQEHGFSGPAALAGAWACAQIMIKLMGGRIMEPYTKRLYRWGKKKTRLDRVFEWFSHYWFDHPGGKRGCDWCPTKALGA